MCTGLAEPHFRPSHAQKPDPAVWHAGVLIALGNGSGTLAGTGSTTLAALGSVASVASFWPRRFASINPTRLGDFEMYQHGITRRYLMLDQHNRAYRYTGDNQVQTPVALAVEWVFDGIEEMGWTRETAYDEDFVAEKHRQFREAGWTVITTGTSGSGELLRELDVADAELDKS